MLNIIHFRCLILFSHTSVYGTLSKNPISQLTPNIVSRPGEDSEANLREFPFAALIGYRVPRSLFGQELYYGCGGSLINARY